MVVALEQAKITVEQLETQSGSNVELQSQVDILKGTIKLMEEQIVVYKNLQDMQAKMSEAKDTLHAQELKAVTPTFMDKLKTNILAGGVGAVVTVVVILLLHL
jgi:hydroxyacyl-ACP dehydratase HTD2-like protein with hotdog domain